MQSIRDARGPYFTIAERRWRSALARGSKHLH